MKEFKVNEYITLKLEGGRTNIYVKGQLFNHCMFLLTNSPIDSEGNQNEISSVDEAAEKLGWTYEGQKQDGKYVEFTIPPEIEFWGYCSNLQVWAENNYDSRLLHSSIAFPLLKKLTEVEDPQAKNVFEDEILDRFFLGHPSLDFFFLEADYLQLISTEKMRLFAIGVKEIGDISLISKLIEKFHYWEEEIYFFWTSKKKDSSYFGERDLFELIFDNFENSKLKTRLNNFFKGRENVESGLKILKNLINWKPTVATNYLLNQVVKDIDLINPAVIDFLILEGFLEHVPRKFILSALDKLDCYIINEIIVRLQHNDYIERKKGIYLFLLLEEFIPTEIKEVILKKINSEKEKLNWITKESYFYKDKFERKDLISTIKLIEEEKERYWLKLDPSYVDFIKGLESLTRIDTRPIEYMDEMQNSDKIGVQVKQEKIIGLYISFLKEDAIDYFKLDYIPEVIRNISSLEELYFVSGNIEQIPEWLCDLKNLRKLCLDYNNIKSIPEPIGKLTLLESLSLRGNYLSNLPDSMKDIKHLQKLDVASNHFHSVPKVIKHLTNLTNLCLNSNFISEIENLENLPNLWILSLRDNLIPEEMLTNLGGIWINTGSANFPQNFVRYCQNKIIEENPHPELEYVTIKEDKFYIWNNVLNLSKLNLKSIDEISGFENVKKLEILDLSWNELKKISGLSSLTHLKKLNLDRNDISKVEGLENLKELESLILDVELIRKLVNLSIVKKDVDIKNYTEIINPQKVIKYCQDKIRIV